jgi:glycosyltransferase involved in cell wall biosynthesis
MNEILPGPPTLSVFIRVRNEAEALSQLLKRLSSQHLDVRCEIVVLDNQSDDGSADVAQASGSRVFVLPRHLFGFGRALNLGIELCRGDFVVLLSAHAFPESNDWLQTMLDALRADPNVGGAYCRQVPLLPLSRQEMRRYLAFGQEGYTVRKDDLLASAVRGADAYEICRFSNSASIVRRSAALQCPFRDLPYAEDRAFALDALLHGLSIAYVPEAAVAYERPWSLRSLYHTGRRAQVAKQLIREIAATGLGCETRRSELPRILGRLILKPLATAARIAGAPIVDRGASARACRYALASWGTTLGMLAGELSWQQQTATAGCDAASMLAARTQLYPFQPRPGEAQSAAPHANGGGGN